MPFFDLCGWSVAASVSVPMCGVFVWLRFALFTFCPLLALVLPSVGVSAALCGYGSAVAFWTTAGHKKKPTPMWGEPLTKMMCLIAQYSGIQTWRAVPKW